MARKLLCPESGAHIYHPIEDEEVRNMSRITRWASALSLSLGLLALAGPAAADQSDHQESGSYGYLRVVEGSATLMQAGSRDRSPAEVNQPVMAGDRIQVADGSRVEIVLADHNLVRLDGGSELLLEHLAASPDANDPATVLRLLEGDAQLVVTNDSLGDQLPRLDTPNATVYPQDFGVYRVAAERGGWSEVTVRRGKAQVVTDQGSEDIRADEQAVVEADVNVQDATGYDNLERWAQRLDQDYQQADDSYVDEDLRYSAAPLNRYGSWVNVSGQQYWRPRVDNDWRPYTAGRWIYTPSGMTWVSSEPWGWVPYHYGSWDFVSGYGWLWQPGSVYAPAWVYWYWGPSYTGWCPIGYYTRYYASAGFSGFHSGVYGWAGGDWGLFSRWTFVSSSYWRGYHDGFRNGFRDGRGHWDVRRYAVSVDEFRRSGRSLERGIITTDTRPLRPDTWTDPGRAVRVLGDQPSGRRNRDQGGELPDVTSFVARKPQLSPHIAQVVKGAPDDINRYVGTPLQPGTLGHVNGGRGMRGARVTPVPQGQPGIENNGRTPRVRPVPDQGAGGMTEPGRGGRRGGPRVTPIDVQPAPGNPRSGRPAPGDQGGAPRPDRGGQPGHADRGDRANRGPRVTPVQPPPQSRPDRPNRPDRNDRGDQGNRGNQNDRGNQGNRDQGNRRESPPKREPDRPAVRQVDPPPPSAYRSYGNPGDRGDRNSRPAYTPPPASRPAPERYAPPPRMEHNPAAPQRVEPRPAPPPAPQQHPAPPPPPEQKKPEHHRGDRGDHN
jgi:hypothetical protein